MKRLKKSMAARAAAAFFASLFLTLFVISSVVFAAMIEFGVYTSSREEVRENVRYPSAFGAMYRLCEEFIGDGDVLYCNDNFTFNELGDMVSSVILDGGLVFDIRANYEYITERIPDEVIESGPVFTHKLTDLISDQEIYQHNRDWLIDPSTGNIIDVTIRIASVFTTPNVADLLYDNKILIPVAAVVSVISAILLLAFTVSAAGHRRGTDEIALSPFDRVPLDLLACTAFIISALLLPPFSDCFNLICRTTISFNISWTVAAVACVVIVFLFSLLLTVLMSTVAARIKCGTFFKNNLITRALRYVKRAVMAVPIIWRTLLASIAFAVLTLIIFVNLDYLGFMTIVFLALLWGFGIAVLSYNAWCMRRLRIAGHRIASGDLSFRVNTDGLHGDYRLHAEDLNNIGAGIETAVNERMKSERFRAELITNVSHDIRTPLTSIINYIDLLKTPDIDAETVRSYIEVLDRQSQRLRRLTDDLIEASKASSGTLPVTLEPIELSLLLSQTAGEYSERLEQCGLSLVTRAPEGSISVMADGRHTSRIIDNLMSNVCKYALSGTRVYIEIVTSGKHAGISISNISREPLGKSVNELTERFVRGDESRHTEGSGLGLSIASSLAEIQGAALSIETISDLFRATLWMNMAE